MARWRGRRRLTTHETFFDNRGRDPLALTPYRPNGYWLAHTMRATHSTPSKGNVRSGCSGLSDFNSHDLVVLRLTSFAITSPSLVLTTTRSPRRSGTAGDTMITVPSR